MAPRNAPHFMLAIGLPRYATEEPEPEDNAGPEDLLSTIFRELKSGDEATAHAVLGFADALRGMASAVLQDNDRAFSKAADEACGWVEQIEGGEHER